MLKSAKMTKKKKKKRKREDEIKYHIKATLAEFCPWVFVLSDAAGTICCPFTYAYGKAGLLIIP